MASYGKPMPEKFYADAWWNDLIEFQSGIIGKAFSLYADENPTFPPHANAIRHICTKLLSESFGKRLGAEEAWAIALSSRDESETVVWTEETAEAFSACSPVLEIGDEVGARMAFKEAYARIVAKNESEGVRVKWVASLGWDLRRREAVLNKAANAGLLPAPVAAKLLPAPQIDLKDENNPLNSDIVQENLQRIKQMLSEMQSDKISKAEKASIEEREKTISAKKKIAQQVDEKLGQEKCK